MHHSCIHLVRELMASFRQKKKSKRKKNTHRTCSSAAAAKPRDATVRRYGVSEATSPPAGRRTTEESILNESKYEGWSREREKKERATQKNRKRLFDLSLRSFCGKKENK